MFVLVLLFVVLVVAAVGAGVLAHRRAWTVAGGPLAWGQALGGRFGAGGGAAVALVAGAAVTAVVGLGMGFLAKAVENPVDHPIFRWVRPRADPASKFSDLNEKLTMMGNNPITQLVALLAAVVLAFAFGRRRWPVPVVALVVAVVLEKYLQKFLGRVVDRGHPPTTLGTYPSGGVGRILAIYGTVVVLVIVLQPTLRREWRAGLWTGVVTAAVIEAYSRVYLSKHWFTDAAFGLVFGGLLLLTMATAVAALTGARSPAPVRSDQPQRADAVG